MIDLAWGNENAEDTLLRGHTISRSHDHGSDQYYLSDKIVIESQWRSHSYYSIKQTGNPSVSNTSLPSSTRHTHIPYGTGPIGVGRYVMEHRFATETVALPPTARRCSKEDR